jgi:hypothetical protein
MDFAAHPNGPPAPEPHYSIFSKSLLQLGKHPVGRVRMAIRLVVESMPVMIFPEPNVDIPLAPGLVAVIVLFLDITIRNFQSGG